MTRYLISFDDGSMRFPAEDLPAVGAAAHAVVAQAKAAGAWVTGGGVERQAATVVARDGSATTTELPAVGAFIGGFAIVDVASRDEALTWAARFAAACRCAQEVRELMDDPEV